MNLSDGHGGGDGATVIDGAAGHVSADGDGADAGVAGADDVDERVLQALADGQGSQGAGDVAFEAGVIRVLGGQALVAHGLHGEGFDGGGGGVGIAGEDATEIAGEGDIAQVNTGGIDEADVGEVVAGDFFNGEGEVGAFESGVGQIEGFELAVGAGVEGGEIIGFEGSFGDGDGDQIAVDVGVGGFFSAGNDRDGKEEARFEGFERAEIKARVGAGGTGGGAGAAPGVQQSAKDRA